MSYRVVIAEAADGRWEVDGEPFPNIEQATQHARPLTHRSVAIEWRPATVPGLVSATLFALPQDVVIPLPEEPLH
jgi:hypothetical protein